MTDDNNEQNSNDISWQSNEGIDWHSRSIESEIITKELGGNRNPDE